MSLYDKYHSNHNKNYMYNLIGSLIKGDYQIDITTNKPYNDYYEINFKETFISTITEDIKVLNKKLLDTQIDYFTNTLLPSGIVKPEAIQSDKECIISSIKRNIYLDSSTRFNYKFTLPSDSITYKLESIIIPIEESSTFSTPILTLLINKLSIHLHLRGTIQLNKRDYGIYTPFSDKELLLKDTISIQIKNLLPCNYKLQSDIFEISDITNNNSKQTLTFKHDITPEFKVNDYIKINNYDKLETSCKNYQINQYKIIGKTDTSITIETNDTLLKGYYVMNITIQNIIYLSYA